MVWCGDMRTFPHRHFEVPEDPKALGRLFSVPDFVGDACKALASRVRGADAAVHVQASPQEVLLWHRGASQGA